MDKEYLTSFWIKTGLMYFIVFLLVVCVISIAVYIVVRLSIDYYKKVVIDGKTAKPDEKPRQPVPAKSDEKKEREKTGREDPAATE